MGDVNATDAVCMSKMVCSEMVPVCIWFGDLFTVEEGDEFPCFLFLVEKIPS